MLRTECHNFNEGRFVMFVVIKFEFLPCNQCEPCANSFFVLGDKTVNCLLNARKGDVFGAWRVHVIVSHSVKWTKTRLWRLPLEWGSKSIFSTDPNFCPLKLDNILIFVTYLDSLGMKMLGSLSGIPQKSCMYVR